jgi:hypothetical protein
MLYNSIIDVIASIAVHIQLDDRLYTSTSDAIARIAVHLQLMTDSTARQVM